MQTIIKETSLGNHKILEAFLIITDGWRQPPVIHILSMKVVDNRLLRVKAWLLPEIVSFLKDGTSLVVLIVNVQNKESFMFKGHCISVNHVVTGVPSIEKQYHFPQVQGEVEIEIEELQDLTI